MIELVTVGDRKFEILQRIRIPSKTDAEKLGKALEGMVYLRKNDDPQCIFIINEVVDAKFEDSPITEPQGEIVNLEEKKKVLLNAISEMTGSETPKIA